MHELPETASAATVSTSIPPYDDRQLVKWIEGRPEEDHYRMSRTSFEYLLEKAAQPRHASSNACIKLCYLIDQCRGSASMIIRDFVFSEKTCLDLFNFYIEWNEKNQNRSMRQVLELVSSLVVRNPSKEVSVTLKDTIAERTLAIITHQAAQPLVKPAFKCLEYLIGKGTIPVEVLLGTDDGDATHNTPELKQASWDDFFSGTFEWMVLPDVSPAAGKFLVTVFRALKDQQSNTTSNSDFSSSWQRWISKGLEKNPESLENVKNYLFPPLFKLDRAGSIIFLEDLNAVPLSGDRSVDGLDSRHLLRLSAMEQGKKAGLIEEPTTLDRLKTGKKTSAAIVLSEDTLRPLVFHASDTVRSLAFSVLISTLSSIRPFSSQALVILKSCMSILYSDPDAKFRNEVLSNTKHMIERLRGATSFLAREVEALTYQPQELDKVDEAQKTEQDSLRGLVSAVLDAHRDFVAWYLEFLLGEMVPTASYQRHITTLRAIILLLQSGLHNGIPKSTRVSGNATAWPFSIYFFTPRAIRLLLDLLLDPFEDVRSTAADILRLASPQDFDKKARLVATLPKDFVLAAENPSAPSASQSMVAGNPLLHAPSEVNITSNPHTTSTPQEIIHLIELSKKNEDTRHVLLSEPLDAATMTDTKLNRRFDSSIEGDSSVLQSPSTVDQKETHTVDTKSDRLADKHAPSDDLGPSQSRILGKKERAADIIPSNKQDPREKTSAINESVESKDTLQASNDQRTDIEERAETEGQGETEELLASRRSTPVDLKERAGVKSLGVLLEFIDIAKTISRQTGRADYADGLARSYELLYVLQPSIMTKNNLVSHLIDDLEEKLQAAENNLGQAVLEAPIHGNFAALRFIWDSPTFTSHETISQIHELGLRSQLDALQLRLTKACIRIWQAVKDILCNDSPEGHLLEEAEEVDTVDTKNILSYSFRAIHESSNLLRSLLSKIKIALPDGTSLLPIALFEPIGELSFEQLSTLRHRGAFSTVSLTFTMCCTLTQYTGPGVVTKIDHHLKKWYDETLKHINSQASTTRRSAGIPSLVTAIMAARSLQVTFPEIMQDLTKIAWRDISASKREDTNLPQVHAMNSLKDAFKSASLGSLCEPYIGNCLQLVLHSIKSDLYPIRNCALALFRSIMDVLFGTSVGKSEIENGWDGQSVKIQYDRYPELGNALSKLLETPKSSENKRRPELVLPALDILRRSGPPPGDFTQLVQKVKEQLGSSEWRVREMAGLALCALTMNQDWRRLVIDLISNTPECVNLRHGNRVAARYIIDRHSLLEPLAVVDLYQEVVDACGNAHEFELQLPESPSLSWVFILAEVLKSRNAMLAAVLSVSKVPQSIRTLPRIYLHKLSETAFTPNTESSLSQAWFQGFFLTAALKREFQMMLRIAERAASESDMDVMLAIMPTILLAFKSDTELTRVVQAFSGIYRRSKDVDVQTAALCHLSDLFEDKYNTRLPQEQRDCIFRQLDIPWPKMGNPMLENAWTRFSCWIMVLKMSRDSDVIDQLSEDLKVWARVLKACGQAENEYDSRLSAVKAIQGFFSNIDPSKLSNSGLVPVLFVLYDSLNDDDSDIRNIAANVVSKLARVSLTELAAADWLSGEMLRLHRGSSVFSWDVVQRVAGSGLTWQWTSQTQDYQPVFQSLASQLESVKLKDNGVLFNVEKSNLYIDDVRELELWAKILAELAPQNSQNGKVFSPWESRPINCLLRWTYEGLRTVVEMSTDSSSRWQSDPFIFTACMRVAVCTRTLNDYRNAVFKGNENAETEHDRSRWSDIWKGVDELFAEWTVKSFQVSGFHQSLLAEILKRQPEESFLRRFYYRISSKFSLVASDNLPVIGPRYETSHNKEPERS